MNLQNPDAEITLCSNSNARHHRQQRASGFTLIELLVVVSIIAILASIAIPNFLEAQTRAKVARMQADMRSVATALEAYRLDANGYPVRQAEPDINGGTTSPFGDPRTRDEDLAALTTPISYISVIPTDIFENTMDGQMITDGPASYEWETSFSIIEYWEPGIVFAQIDANNGSPNSRSGKTVAEIRRLGENTSWALISVGPDGQILPNGSVSNLPGGRSTISQSFPVNGTTIWPYMMDYDPSNGTISTGNIFRLNTQQSAFQFYSTEEIN